MLNVVRGSVLAMVFALMLGAVVAYFTPGSATADTEPGNVQVEVRQAIEDFFGALMTGEPDKVAATLAPEFQILRADGSTHDAAGYPTSILPIIAQMPEISKLKVTVNGDVAVAVYYIDADQTRDGSLIEAYAPRLSVFQNVDGKWLLAAHGNFATVAADDE